MDAYLPGQKIAEMANSQLISLRPVLYYALRSMPYGNSFHGLGHACRQASLTGLWH